MREIQGKDLNNYIDVAAYASGLYIVIINTAKETYSLKFIKI